MRVVACLRVFVKLSACFEDIHVPNVHATHREKACGVRSLVLEFVHGLQPIERKTSVCYPPKLRAEFCSTETTNGVWGHWLQCRPVVRGAHAVGSSANDTVTNGIIVRIHS